MASKALDYCLYGRIDTTLAAHASFIRQSKLRVNVFQGHCKEYQNHDTTSVDFFIGNLKDCRKKKDICTVRKRHTEICFNGLECHSKVGSYLVWLFADCGSLSDAQNVFQKLVDQDAFAYSCLMQGFMEHGMYWRVFDLFRTMQECGISFSRFIFLLMLKVSARLNRLDIGRNIHMEIMNDSYNNDPFIGNTLVDMYAKCGSLQDARRVFDTLVSRDVVSWTSIINGYVENEYLDGAFECWDQMQMDRVTPNAVTFASILSICGKIGDLDKGQIIYADLVKDAFEQDTIVGNTLIDMFGRNGFLVEAKNVFNELEIKDVISWTSLISAYARYGFVKEAMCWLDEMQRGGISPNLVCWNTIIGEYAEYGCGEEALECLETMQQKGVQPNMVTWTSSIKACTRMRNITKGQTIHTHIAKEEFENDPFIGNALIDMYCKCGLIIEARETFDNLNYRDVISWTTLVSGYVEVGLVSKALECMEEMQMKGFTITTITWNALIAGCAEQGFGDASTFLEKMQLTEVSPDNVTYACSLKLCATTVTINSGRAIHASVVKAGLENDLLVSCNLVDLYAKCYLIREAEEIFHGLSVRDALLWNTLIVAYTQNNHISKVMECFHQMHLEGISPDAEMFYQCLKLWDNNVDLTMGQYVHNQIIKQGFETDLTIRDGLVRVYLKSGMLLDAHDVFKMLRFTDVLSWNVLINSYVQQGLGNQAVEFLSEMQLRGISPDYMTYAYVLSGIQEKALGKVIHSDIIKAGNDCELSTGNALVDMYAKHGSVMEMKMVFDAMLYHDEMSWTKLITGYVRHKLGNEALILLNSMQSYGLCPVHETFIWGLRACAMVRNLGQGLLVHSQIIKHGVEKDPFLANAMIDMYVKCASWVEAQELFHENSVRNLVSWNTLIMGFTDYGLNEETMDYLNKMNEEGVLMDNITIVGILKACSNLGFLDMGQAIHVEAVKRGFETDYNVSSTLVDMYTRCGLLADAFELFEDLPVQDLIAWTAIMTGYAFQGDYEKVVKLFENMKDYGIESDGVTFLSVLTCCCHGGLLNEGMMYFQHLFDSFVTLLSHEHCNCVVDIIARAGQLNTAVEILERMPLQPKLTMWITLLGACKTFGNFDLGKIAFGSAQELAEEKATPFILMLNIYGDVYMGEKGDTETCV